jgi:hypothetical protein
MGDDAGARCLRISVLQSLDIIEWLTPKDRPISAGIYDAVADKHFSHLDYADLRQPDPLERWAYVLMR